MRDRESSSTRIDNRAGHNVNVDERVSLEEIASECDRIRQR